MSTFTCICGFITRESEEAPETNGVLISLRTLNQLVVRQAYGLSKLVETTQESKNDWVTKYLGSDYPRNFSITEVIEDFLDAEINVIHLLDQPLSVPIVED
ncbi:hypothetical protein [Pleurocapsa sp. PCC 7319]|uniref:hypothetical protein n=1 Tax=Pleurocapsa sp. PCC 7319 TaxID=118161 RepID=UPI000477F3EC|nr:hypothetical protein [Pleurocapsa sp. PCC 7319]